MAVHPTAIVARGAEIGDGARIGPYCIVGAGAKLAADVELVSHVSISGDTTIGARTIVHPSAVLGGPPQHTGYKGEPTQLVIGADCIVRELAHVHRGTVGGGGVTSVGDRCFLMSGCHIGHDCRLANDVTVASNAGLGGHCLVEEFVFFGGLSAVHQYTRIGAYAFIGGGAAVAMDVIPYGSAMGNRARLGGLNIIGLKRRGLARDVIQDMRAAYRAIFESEEGTFQERVGVAEAAFGSRAEVRRILDFIKFDASRPIMGPR